MKAKAYLVKRTNGVFYARYPRGNSWACKSLGTTRRAEAHVRFAAWLQKRETAESASSEIAVVSLEVLAEEYLRYVKAHKSAAWHSRQILYLKTFIKPFFGAATLSTAITSRMIEQYQEHRKNSVKAVTVKKEVACIRHLFRKAEEWGHVAINPTKKVKDLPDDSEPRQRFLSPEEFTVLRQEARDSRPTCWNLPGEPFLHWPEFLTVAVATGLRRAELLNLEFTDVDLQHRVLRVRNKPSLGFHVKNYQERYVPLTSETSDAILRLWATKHPSTEFVFHKSNGDRWQDLSEGLDALVRRAGLDLSAGQIGRAHV